MGKQYNKVEKRKRRNAHLKRKKAAAKPKPKPAAWSAAAAPGLHEMPASTHFNSLPGADFASGPPILGPCRKNFRILQSGTCPPPISGRFRIGE